MGYMVILNWWWCLCRVLKLGVKLALLVVEFGEERRHLFILGDGERLSLVECDIGLDLHLAAS